MEERVTCNACLRDQGINLSLLTRSNILQIQISMAVILDITPIFIKQYQICLYIKQFLIILDSRFFNSLSTYIKDISCKVKEFKHLLKNFLYLNSFYTLEEYFHYNNS